MSKKYKEEKKRNTTNVYNNDILQRDMYDSNDIIIGRYNFQLQSADDDDYTNHDVTSLDESNLEHDSRYNIAPDDKFSRVSHLFKNFTHVHVSMTYYPFHSSYEESNYYIHYLDEDNYNILKCPSCAQPFSDKIYVMDRSVVICRECYRHEKKIYV